MSKFIDFAWQSYIHEILIPPIDELTWLKKGFFDGYEYGQKSQRELETEKASRAAIIELLDEALHKCGIKSEGLTVSGKIDFLVRAVNHD